jgi:ssDNA thymidine ADP-ribosyltransferase, DarT
MDLEKIKIYRMVHIENIPHILKNGITHRNSINANPDFITIGDTSLIQTRSTRKVHIDNGDFLNLQTPAIILGDFIPFYFGVKMPMLYVMQNGGNFVERPTPATNIVYLACSLWHIIQSDKDYYFSDGHGTDGLTTFYDKEKIADLPAIIDWDAVKAPFWGGQENLNIKRKKQAEFLVSDDIPPGHIIGLICYNLEAKAKLVAWGVDEEKIKIHPNAYF